MKTSKLVYKASKEFVQCGKQRVINLTVSLDDDCNNKHHDFSITSMVYEGGKLVGGGCNHEEIVKHFPELKPYIPLHLCGHEGEPSYPVENGIYFFKHEPMLKVMEYMRITEEEYTKLAHHIEYKDYFKYLLFSLGIVARWKKEADEFIKFLEEKTGNEWVNPYSEDEEKFRLVLTEEERLQCSNVLPMAISPTRVLHSVAKKNGMPTKCKRLKRLRKSTTNRLNDSTSSSLCCHTSFAKVFH